VFAHIVPAVPPLLVPYAFHMPLFFFLSGLTLRVDLPLRRLIAREFRESLLFYGLSAAALSLISLYLLPMWGINLGTSSPFDWKTYLVYPLTKNSHNVELFLVGWFILALSAAKIMIFLIAQPLKHRPAGLAGLLLSSALLCWFGMDILPGLAGKSASLWNFASQVSVGAAFCAVGIACSKVPARVLEKLPQLGLVAYLAAVFIGPIPMIMAWSEYPGAWLTHFATALLLIIATLGAARLLAGSAFAQTIGARTKSIMTWHLFSFAAVNTVLVSFGVLRGADVGVFTFHEPARWWSVYVVAGLLLPTLMAYGYRRFVRQLRWTIGPLQNPKYEPGI
jgi:hypothetical protein